MLKHLFLVTLNQLWHQKLYTVISLLSLTIGLVIFFLNLLHVRHEFSYNRGWADAESIYRLSGQEEAGNSTAGVGQGFSELQTSRIEDYISDLVVDYETAVSLNTWIKRVDQRDADRTALRTVLIEQSFLDLFQPEVIAGDLESLWSGPGLIALEAGKAIILFGSETAALDGQVVISGQTVNATGTMYQPGRDTVFTVAAVYKLPEPVTAATRFESFLSSGNYAFQLLMSHQGGPELSSSIWLKPVPGVTAVDIEGQLSELRKQEESSRQFQGVLNSDVEYKLENLTGIYFNQDKADQLSGLRGNLPRVYTFLIVGMLVLAAGCSNTISLGLASALSRQREIGIRKSMGATGKHIFLQYQGASLLLTIIALLPVLLLVHFCHPVFYSLFDISTMSKPDSTDYLLLSGLAMIVAVINGFYPSLVLARLKPVLVLKPYALSTTHKVTGLRTVLVTAQFVFSVLLMTIALGLYLQLQHTFNRPAGFAPDNLAQVYLDSEDVRTVLLPGLLAELRQTPGILQAEAVSTGPSVNQDAGAEVMLRRTPDPSDGIITQLSRFSANQFSLAGIALLAGEPFQEAYSSPGNTGESAPQVLPVVINRSAMRALGFADTQSTIGHEIFLNYQMLNNPDLRPVRITAVVEDSTYHNIKASPVPAVYVPNELSNLSADSTSIASHNYILLRYDETVENDVIVIVSSIWEKVAGRYPLNVFFVEEAIRAAYADELNESRLMLLCAVVTMALAIAGLYGLVSVHIATTAGDIAVRKAMGASRGRIVLGYFRQYSVPVVLSCLFAWPLGVYFLMQWIERFPSQLDKLLLIPVCISAGLLVLIVAWLALAGLVVTAAAQNPVKSLRYE